MALKNLYDMVKADRYTADGREELIKAQEAETEDKVYQIGEISQKTGLQKTANGWVKPKSGKAPGAKTGEGKSPKAAGSKPEGMPGRDYPALKKEDHVKLAKEVKSNTLPGGSDWTAEEIAKEWQLGKADAEEVKKEFDKLKTESKPAEKKFTGSWENDKNNLTPTQLQGISRLAKTSNLSESEVYENVKELIMPKSEKQIAAEQKKIDKSIAREKTKFKALEGSDINSFKKKMDQMGYQFSPKEKDSQVVGGSTWGTFGYNSAGKPEVDFDYSEEKGVHNIRFIDEEKAAAESKTAGDAAPRVLTGDTKIRVRKA